MEEYKPHQVRPLLDFIINKKVNGSKDERQKATKVLKEWDKLRS